MRLDFDFGSNANPSAADSEEEDAEDDDGVAASSSVDDRARTDDARAVKTMVGARATPTERVGVGVERGRATAARRVTMEDAASVVGTAMPSEASSEASNEASRATTDDGWVTMIDRGSIHTTIFIFGYTTRIL